MAHETVNFGHDRDQPAHMAKLAKEASDGTGLIALSDLGYYEGYEILECEGAGVAAVVRKPRTSNNAAAGLSSITSRCSATPSSATAPKAALRR